VTEPAAPRRSATRRVFVAIPLPAATREEIGAVVERVRADADPAARDVRWVRLEGLHLTLRFLGQTPDELLPGLKAAIDRVAASMAPFRVVIGGAGAFPSVSSPRTLWLAVTEGAAELAASAAVLDDALADAGWPRSDRPYRAHLTLARSDGIATGPRVASRLVDAAKVLHAPFEATTVTLFETVAGGGPARYSPIYEARFRQRSGGRARS
jgi:RNA 2',3'-cyclic 3'-phosphodiesterase